MDHKREIPKPHKNQMRRKKRKKSGMGGDPPKPGNSPKPGQKAQARPKQHVKPKDRRKEGGTWEKVPKTEPLSATPRDLRLGNQGKGRSFTPDTPPKHVPKRYGVIIYETFAAAKADKDQIASKAREFDQFNVVIRAEGNMDDPELVSLGPVKVFAGAAWALIHERRIQDGWYEVPQ